MFMDWHSLTRIGLGVHGSIHVVETLLNIYEDAYYSACLSLISSIIMILGVFLGTKTLTVKDKT